MHSTENRYPCVACSRTYKTASFLRRHHYLKHASLIKNNLECSESSFTSDTSHLNQNYDEIDSKGKTHQYRDSSYQSAYQFKVALDSKSDSYIDQLDQHQPDCKLYKCTKCSYNTNCYSIYSQHLSKHSGQPIQKLLDKQHAIKNDYFDKSGNHHLIKHPGNKSCYSQQGHCASNRNRISKESIRLKLSRKEIKSKPLKCKECSFTCKYLTQLNVHKRRHTTKKHYACPDCNFLADSTSNLSRHSIIHSGKRPHKCPKCPFTCNRADNLKKHITWKHSGEKIVNKLGLNSTSQSILVKSKGNSQSEKKPLSAVSPKLEHGKNVQWKHLREAIVKNTECSDGSSQSSHQGQITKFSANDHYACLHCSYRTACKSNFISHLIIHSGKSTYKCPQCPHISNDPNNFKRHIQRKHFWNKTVSKRFRRAKLSQDTVQSRLITLNHKIKRSGNTAYACPHCNYQAHYSYSFKRHIMIHSGEKPLKCPHCPYASIWNGNLLKHITALHSEEKRASKPINNTKCSDDSKQSNFLETKICGKLSVKSLGSYKIKRSDKNSYACPYCNFGAANKTRLSTHISIIHSKEKPYKCEQCPYVSKWNHNLKQHIRFKHSVKERVSKPSKNTIHSTTADTSQSSRFKSDVNTYTEKKCLICPHCYYRTEFMPHFTRHLLTHNGTNLYRCHRCQLKFTRQGSLIAHLRRSHRKENTSSVDVRRSNNSMSQENGEEKSLESPLSDYRSRLRSRSMRVLINYSRKTPYNCLQCPYRSLLNRNFRDHIRLKHSGMKTGLKQMNATRSSINTSQSRLDASNKMKHSQKNAFACSHCNYQTQKESFLKCHLMTHSGEKPFKCPHCPYACIWKGNLSKHILYKHSGKKVVSEPKSKKYLCASRSSRNSPFHKNRHSDKTPFVFPDCNYQMSKQNLLNQHLTRGLGKKRYKCTKCLYASKWKGNLKAHMEFKHSGKEIVSKAMSKECLYATTSPGNQTFQKNRHSDKTTFVCPHCNYQTPVKSFFNCHLMIHARKKPYKCLQCSYAYFLKGDFLNHLKWKHSGKEMMSKTTTNAERLCEASHSSVKNHNIKHSMKASLVCPQCNYQTPVDSFMNRHLMMHSRNNPYKCMQCPYTTNWKVNWKKHMKLKHSGKDLAFNASEMTDHTYSTNLVSLLSRSMMRNSKKTRFSCSHCAYQTPTKNFINHHLMIHSRQKFYECLQQRNFKKVQTLDDSRKKMTSKMSLCFDHSYAASSPILFTSHMNTYSGMKPFSCPHCKYWTHLNCMLKRHLNIHTNKNTFNCQYCHFKSFSEANLKSHRQFQHSGKRRGYTPFDKIKPYSCPHECSYASKWKGNLKQHMKSKHAANDACSAANSEISTGSSKSSLVKDNMKKWFLCSFKAFGESSLHKHIESTHSEEEIVSKVAPSNKKCSWPDQICTC